MSGRAVCLCRVGKMSKSFGMRNLMKETFPRKIDLAGEWSARIDPEGAGGRQEWFREEIEGSLVSLPRTMDTHKLVPPATEGDLQGFTPAYPYEGAIWYQRGIVIPENWAGKRIALYLERCQWESAAWVDGEAQGSANSLVGPHVYDLSAALTPGAHRLTIRVDNANRKEGKAVARDDMTANLDLTTEIQGGRKLNCGGHHLWSHNWVGILGEMTLTARDAVRLDAVDVFPRVGAGEIAIRIAISNDTGARQKARIRAVCAPSAGGGEQIAQETWEIELTGEAMQAIERTLAPASPVRLWDEFDPALYTLTVEMESGSFSDSGQVRFGMREIGTVGCQFAINGRAVFMRGNVENFVFPLTGHPPMDVESWRKVLATAKSYGLNFFRFHTCCPPAAAFDAADELGFYFQVEVPGTSCPFTDEEPAVGEFLGAELARMLAWHGNHASLLFVSMGNEQLITDDRDFQARHAAVLAQRVCFGKESDGRHIYTSTSHPINGSGGDDFHVSAWPQEGPAGEPLCGIRWGGDRVIDTSRFNTRRPETGFDYRAGIAGLDRPVMTHEVGQWAVYPDLREIGRYDGVERAFNFEIIRERLREKGLLEWAGDFTRASGMLSLLLYKEEIESALRTPGLGGFQLLCLTDYPGQGTSTVGILNSLWESKGLTTPAEFRSFCGPAAPLARMEKRVWTQGERFAAQIDFANYGPADIAGDIAWSIAVSDGKRAAEGSISNCRAEQGGLSRLGEVSTPLDGAPAPAKLVLRVEMAGYANAWDFWVYPNDAPGAAADGITISSGWDRATRGAVENGGSVLLVPPADRLREPVPGTFTTSFWNVQMKHLQVSKTMGLLCDPAHPALALFPTDFHTNWQWWEIVMGSQAMKMDGLPVSLWPIVRVIDSFTENRRLGMVFEARVGKGRLLVCSADISSDLERRPAARQLRHSLLEYMTSALFLPEVSLTEEELETVFVEY